MVSKEETEKAPVAEASGLVDYELVVLISPELAEERLDAVIGNITKFITDRGGVLASVDRWGKKKLAYPIKRFKEASYILARFKFGPTSSRELEASLRITEDVLRHLLIRIGD